MKVISFINMKGGVGKTTSTVEIATILASEHKKKVLLVDFDAQTNATFSFMSLEEWEKVKDYKTMREVLGMTAGYSSRDKTYNINKAIAKRVCGIDLLDLIPSHPDLAFFDLDLGRSQNREYILKKQLETLEEKYDFILIDCPPNLTLASQNALLTSDYVIIPITPEFYPYIGLPELQKHFERFEHLFEGCKFKILGIILTKVRSSTNEHKRFLEGIRKTAADNMSIKTFKSEIPENIEISEATSKNKPATLHRPDSKGVIKYRELTQEILDAIEEENA